MLCIYPRVYTPLTCTCQGIVRICTREAERLIAEAQRLKNLHRHQTETRDPLVDIARWPRSTQTMGPVVEESGVQAGFNQRHAFDSDIRF